jgi:hypothetical protein
MKQKMQSTKMGPSYVPFSELFTGGVKDVPTEREISLLQSLRRILFWISRE